jgi:hypothetical protein
MRQLDTYSHSPVVQRYDVQNLDAAYGRVRAARGASLDPRALRGLGAGELSATALVGWTVLGAVVVAGGGYLLFQALRPRRRR